MSFPWNITNPGINLSGLITSAERTFVTNLAGLTYSQGDILYVDSGGDLMNLAIGSEGEILKVTSGLPVWGTGSGGSVALNDVTDVTITSPSNGEVLKYNGSAWVNATVPGSGDVTAASNFGTDNVLIRSDGVTKGVQSSGVTVDDSDNITGVATITVDGATGNTVIVNTDDFVVDSTNSRVGIGTAAPGSTLHVNNTSSASEVKVTSSSGNARIALDSDVLGSRVFTYESNGANILFKNSSDSGGNFLMQNATPANVMSISFAAPANGFVLSSSGNVGIGVASPDTILDVNGAITARELSSDPTDPDEGAHVIWQSDGTGSGDDGDIMIKITAGGVTKTATLVDFSVLS